MSDFCGKVVLVTGASSGLGLATAQLLARRGASVVLAARRQEQGEAAARAIIERGGSAAFVRTDVTDPAAVDAMVARALALFGRLDGAVNNAGISRNRATPVADIPDADWQATIDTNLTSAWRCMKAQIPAMLAGGGGSIVNVSSIYGLTGSDLGHAAYSASKFGLIGLTQSAANDYAQRNVRINAVCPGFSRSEMIDPHMTTSPDLMKNLISRHSASNRLGKADEVAQAITWLLSSEASFINGVALPVTGGGTTKLY